MGYRRQHPVKDPRLAARRLLEARTALIKLVLGPDVDGAIAVEISNAIETLEAAAENYGVVRDLEPPAPYVPVTPEELADVRRALEERSAELEARRLQCSACRHPAHTGQCNGRNGGTAYRCPCLLDTPAR